MKNSRRKNITKRNRTKKKPQECTIVSTYPTISLSPPPEETNQSKSIEKQQQDEEEEEENRID